MVGAAERALLARHRAIADDVVKLVGAEAAAVQSASAFRLTYDPDGGRDAVDSSAVANEMGVLRRAVDEQALVPAAASSVGAAVATSADVLTRAEEMLAGPNRVVGLERAEQACRAYDNQWFEEAEELFLAATEHLPTEPYLWFGAGLAASHLAPERATQHLRRAARYLLRSDPGGAAYVQIMAAEIVNADDATLANVILREAVAEMNWPCPAISLHLARMRPDREANIRATLGADPMMAADLLALGLDFDEGAVVAERERQTVRELAWLDHSLKEMRAVDEGIAWSESAGQQQAARPVDGLSLVRMEVRLWRRLRQCKEGIEQARSAVALREEARQKTERQVSMATDAAGGDLDDGDAFPVVIFAAVVVVGLIASRGLEQVLLARFAQRGWLIDAWQSISRAGLVVLFGWFLLDTTWRRRSFGKARRAKAELPGLRCQASQLRRTEFEVRRRFERANEHAELRIRRIVDRRRSIVPKRPTFVADSQTDSSAPRAEEVAPGESGLPRWVGPSGD